MRIFARFLITIDFCTVVVITVNRGDYDKMLGGFAVRLSLVCACFDKKDIEHSELTNTPHWFVGCDGEIRVLHVMLSDICRLWPKRNYDSLLHDRRNPLNQDNMRNSLYLITQFAQNRWDLLQTKPSI